MPPVAQALLPVPQAVTGSIGRMLDNFINLLDRVSRVSGRPQAVDRNITSTSIKSMD